MPASVRYMLQYGAAAPMKTVAEWILASGLSQTELARRLGHKSSGMVNLVVQGKRAISPGKVEAWADALGLNGEDRTLFRAAADAGKIDQKKDVRVRAQKTARQMEALTAAILPLLPFLKRGEKVPNGLLEALERALTLGD